MHMNLPIQEITRKRERDRERGHRKHNETAINAASCVNASAAGPCIRAGIRRWCHSLLVGPIALLRCSTARDMRLTASGFSRGSL